MLNKFKLISTSSTVTILTSIIIVINTHKTSANTFSTLFKNIIATGNKLTIINPFKASTSFTLKKPSSNGKLSYIANNENTKSTINL